MRSGTRLATKTGGKRVRAGVHSRKQTGRVGVVGTGTGTGAARQGRRGDASGRRALPIQTAATEHGRSARTHRWIALSVTPRHAATNCPPAGKIASVAASAAAMGAFCGSLIAIAEFAAPVVPEAYRSEGGRRTTSAGRAPSDGHGRAWVGRGRRSHVRWGCLTAGRSRVPGRRTPPPRTASTAVVPDGAVPDVGRSRTARAARSAVTATHRPGVCGSAMPVPPMYAAWVAGEPEKSLCRSCVGSASRSAIGVAASKSRVRWSHTSSGVTHSRCAFPRSSCPSPLSPSPPALAVPSSRSRAAFTRVRSAAKIWFRKVFTAARPAGSGDDGELAPAGGAARAVCVWGGIWLRMSTRARSGCSSEFSPYHLLVFCHTLHHAHASSAAARRAH